jgi:hypothetical protein
MAHNAVPAFCKNGSLGTPKTLSALNASATGSGTIGTDIFNIFAADATNGSWVENVRLMPTATGSVTLAATVIRIFASSIASGATTATDTHLLAEVALAGTGAASASAAANAVDIPLQFRLPAGWTILATTAVTPAANSGWRAVAMGGDY